MAQIVSGVRVMKMFIWKLVWKIVCKWERVAEENGLEDQAEDCCEIQRYLHSYKNAMRKKGLWK